jgi:hypothetical protein
MEALGSPFLALFRSNFRFGFWCHPIPIASPFATLKKEKIAALISIGYLLHPSIVTVLLQNSISALAGHRRGANFDDQVRWRRP